MKVLKTTLFNNKKTMTALEQSLCVLENNLNILKKSDLKSERVSNDFILQFQIDMEKAELYPLIKPGDEKRLTMVWNDLYGIYRHILKLHSLFLVFYDKTAYAETPGIYSSFISIEYAQISSLKSIVGRLISGKALTRNVLETNSKAYISFKRELFRLSAEPDITSNNPFHSEILSVLNKMSDLNKKILEKVSSIYGIVSGLDENIYKILEETEKAFSKSKFVFNTLLNANKY